jgi:hypothetical protein
MASDLGYLEAWVMAGDRRVLAVAGLGAALKSWRIIWCGQRKSKRANTREVLDRLLATYSSPGAGTCDLAILLLACAGRRRIEVTQPAAPLSTA